MEELAPAPRPPIHRSILRFVHDRNPFYLLSALCLFVGFRVILGGLNSHAGEWHKLLLLIGILNVYEFTILGLGLFLIVRRGLLRDGWFLLSIEALFLVDLTNLNAELYIASPKIGTAVNAVLWALAMLKIAVVVRSLKLRLHRGTAVYVAVQMASLLGLPGLFYAMRSPTETISAMQIYAIWWTAAGLIVAGAAMVHRLPAGRWGPMSPLPWRLYVVVPLVSLLVHLAGQNRVYWIHFHPANLAPVVFAGAVALNLSRLRRDFRVVRWSIGLSAIAAVLSLHPSYYNAELATTFAGIAITPLRVALLSSTALTVWLTVSHRSVLAANVSSGTFALAVLGATPGEIRTGTARAIRWSLQTAQKLVPETEMSWGICAVTAAFMLLALGAFFSLHQTPPRDAAQEII